MAVVAFKIIDGHGRKCRTSAPQTAMPTNQHALLGGRGEFGLSFDYAAPDCCFAGSWGINSLHKPRQYRTSRISPLITNLYSPTGSGSATQISSCRMDACPSDVLVVISTLHLDARPRPRSTPCWISFLIWTRGMLSHAPLKISDRVTSQSDALRPNSPD